jgi:TolB-like protein/class 3 adenylate cyclase
MRFQCHSGPLLMLAIPSTDGSPPTGTVTFLFSDIEGSTRLWEAHPAAMQAAVARHDELMRQSIAARGGHVFKTIGDAFCAAFSTAPQAILAGLSAQQALHAEPWPEALSLRVRMALHAGAVEFRSGDYFGSPLNHAARLLAIAHGGQTLLSEITHDLCRDRLPAGSTLKSLGEHGLKDIARREAIFQLCHPGLPSSFPPLRTAALPSVADETPSIAVLPFINLSRDEENEYFADGLAEELLNVLSRVRGLRVASRTSAFSFKGIKVDIPTVAQKLNVATILEGSVRKAGKRVRITAQLIQVATDSQLWAESYDRELEDIFAVQDDIAQSVVKELRAALLGEKPGALANSAARADVRAAAKGRGEDPEAYRLYLQGRFFMDRATRRDMAKGIGYFREALQLDPRYALVWASLARALMIQANYSFAATAQAAGAARDAAQRALELEPDLVDGHLALAWVRMYHDWDWNGAETAIRRALEIAPGDSSTIRQASSLAQILGRTDEAIALARQAVALDPLNVAGHVALGRWYWSANRLGEAETALEKALELDPQREFTHLLVGLTQLAQGHLDEALAAVDQEVNEHLRATGLAQVHHACGRRIESDAALRDLLKGGATGGSFEIAEAYAYRGDVDCAFEWLERAYSEHVAGVAWAKTLPTLHNLHGDARWRPFLEKLGLAN